MKNKIQFPEIEIVAPLAQQFQFRELIPLKSEEARLFYAKEASERHWGKRELRQSIERKEFERAEIVNIRIASQVTEQQIVPFNIFKDPYFLDMFNLPQNYDERDLENAIISETDRIAPVRRRKSRTNRTVGNAQRRHNGCRILDRAAA